MKSSVIKIIIREEQGEFNYEAYWSWIAIFPEEPATLDGKMTCYNPVGETGQISWDYYSSKTYKHKGKSEKLEDIKRFLINRFGTDIDNNPVEIQFCQRVSSKMRDKFLVNLQSYTRG